MTKKAGKTGKTYHSTMQGVNLKAAALEAAEILAVNEDTTRMLRATAAEAMLNCGKACAKTGELESVNSMAHFFAEARLAQGIKPGTVNKEASQLRGICRACFGGVKVVKKLEENSMLYSHEFAALARKITPKAYRKENNHAKGQREKTVVTEKEFGKMKQWAPLCTSKQRAVIVALFAKQEQKEATAAAVEEGKVVTLKPKAQRSLKRKAA